MEIALTKMSSKGQVVIPAGMRKDMKAGDKLILIKEGNSVIMKVASKMDEQLKEDLEFARRTEEAWKQIDKGNYKSYDAKEFLKKLKQW